ncbi:alpha/beta hydrolase [Candidatus Bathyarchaeota archaeon]|nr:MAG: alpha/beta hydrolase [Candidatus Bathyarchaeota archaeon]
MSVSAGWVNNKGVRLHYLDNRVAQGPPLVPVVFIPGFLNSAEDHRREMDSLPERRCVAVSLRGRGQSDAPKMGYSFADQLSDVEAFVNQIGLQGFCLSAYSVGVSFAIGFASNHPSLLAGLVLSDYSARYPKVREQWVGQVLASREDVKPHVVQAIQQKSAEVLLWDSLEKITCPTLILRGGLPGALLTADGADRYKRQLPDSRVIVFDNSGHNLSQPDYERYIGTIKTFLDELDSAKKSILRPRDAF